MKQMSERQRKVSQTIRQIIALALVQGVGAVDRPKGLITVDDVWASPDLKQTRIFVSFVGTPDEKAMLAHLNGNAYLFQRELARQLRSKSTPRVEFMRYSAATDTLMAALHKMGSL
jgi:ribosome-binding factor A